ncbi:Lipopolysaccharide core heptosyltransferase RfaQ [Pirellulimonas nuda]|uniref:Lipopolysaccharide core heptosyltransferase RfaQ n=1 Tax=Pirellulimonas nuda TaxID=2528009 RepID=A0A518DAG7_9BACT|nr:glycosyltransferase family 9 protein [Pirellulimonas nuda]QDU88469.1 Lipopolysaccharide core heptosyltransferase RfaQ [Pirellulimonas nuda]
MTETISLPMHACPHPRRILVIRLRQLGDTLLATPLLRQLRRLYPAAEIDVLCQPQNEAILRHNPNIDRRIILPAGAGVRRFLEVAAGLRQQKYDWVLDSQAMPKTAVLTRLSGAARRVPLRSRPLRNRLFYTHAIDDAQAPLEYAGRQNLRLTLDPRVDLDDLALDFPIGPESEAVADRFARRYLAGPTAAIFVVASTPERQWPLERFAELADRLADSGLRPLLLYGPGQEGAARSVADRMRRQALVDYPQLGFAELRGVLARCDLFIGNDGGPHHVATAAGVPSVTLFRINPVRWSPPARPHQRFVASTDVASPHEACGLFTPEPFESIPVDAVWRQIERSLSAPALRVA